MRSEKILIATTHRLKEDKNISNFHELNIPKYFDVFLEVSFGLNFIDSINFTINKAIDNEYDYVFFVSDDILIPKNALVDLIKYKIDVIAGFYYHKKYPLESYGLILNNYVATKIEDSDFKVGFLSSIFNGCMISILNLPMGCVLIKTDVFKQIKKIWYSDYIKNNNKIFIDIYDMCKKIKELNYNIMVYPEIQCIHVDKKNGIFYGHEKIIDFKTNQIKKEFRNYFAI
jgi:hypothetical protein